MHPCSRENLGNASSKAPTLYACLPVMHLHALIASARSFLLAWCAIALLVASAHALPPMPDPESPVIPDTPAGKQLAWILKSINARSAPDAAGRFNSRFLEQFSIAEVQDLLSSLRDRSFKGEQVVMLQHEAEPRRDAISCVIGNEDVERYLSLVLSVNEETGLISVMTFTASFSARQTNDGGWNDLAGDMGKLSNGVWFGAYEALFDKPGTPEADVRIRSIYEFGNRKALHLGSASRIYLLDAVASRLASKSLVASSPVGATTLSSIIPSVAKGQPAACDELLNHLTRDEVERVVGSLQENPAPSIPYLSMIEVAALKAPRNKELLAQYAAGDVITRRDLVDSTLAKEIVKPDVPSRWSLPTEFQRVGWFATNKEAAYAVARLALFERDPNVIASWLSELWRQRQDEPVPLPLPIEQLGKPAPQPRLALDFKPTLWRNHLLISGSEPGVMSMLLLLTSTDGRSFVMVLAWNNIEGPLDEPRLYEMAQKGLTILETQFDAPKPEGHAPESTNPEPAQPASSK